MMEIQLPDELAAEVATLAEKRNQSIESLVTEMISEWLKMHAVPGVVFADGATGRRARIAGTGIEVFEVIDRYERIGRDLNRLQTLFDWLKPHQIQSAIRYYELFPEDIIPRLHTDEKDAAALTQLWQDIPESSPDWPARRRPSGSAVRNVRESA